MPQTRLSAVLVPFTLDFFRFCCLARLCVRWTFFLFFARSLGSFWDGERGERGAPCGCLRGAMETGLEFLGVGSGLHDVVPLTEIAWC